MSAATATIRTFFPELNLRKSISCLEFPNSKLIFSGKFVSWKSVPWENRAWSPKTMAESIFRDECVRGLEQEAFIDGSSDFRSNLAAVGLESTLNRLSKWLVVALFGTVILCRHDAEALWAAFGAVINAGLSVILKQILNQERPCSTLRSDPGMPSSHAQSIFFTAVFTILSMVEWLGVNGLTTTLIGLILAIGSYLSWLRVSQQFHTISQVAVGAVVGSIFSILWFWSWDAIVMNAFFSYLWVAIVVVLGAAGFWLGFLFYIIRTLVFMLEDQ